MPEPLSVVVPTFNEEANLRDCLASVRFADEVLVVDSFSTDGTIEIARAMADRVLIHEYVDSASQKNWALPQTKHPWALLVDADERVTPELREEIRRILRDGPKSTAYEIRRVNHFLGRRIRHGGWHNDRVIRLFRRDLHLYEPKRVHAEIEVPGPVPLLEHPLLHYTFRDFDQYLRKIDRYTRWGAEEAFRRGKRAGALEILGHPAGRFVKMYLLRAGFLDGLPGLVLAMMASYSVFLKYVRLYELRLREERGEKIEIPETHAGPPR